MTTAGTGRGWQGAVLVADVLLAAVVGDMNGVEEKGISVVNWKDSRVCWSVVVVVAVVVVFVDVVDVVFGSAAQLGPSLLGSRNFVLHSALGSQWLRQKEDGAYRLLRLLFASAQHLWLQQQQQQLLQPRQDGCTGLC